MPQSDEGKDQYIVDDGSERGGQAARTSASQGNKNVPDEPAVEASMPRAPESDGAIRVGYTP